ncbi:hypothetical protein D8I35_05345 [Corticibacter populi]|uniref:Uncharacterized protein n=1 Tax=Corticibacter populi TaxID=1550736 RepID=A0A3M6R014_9BURK|nr:hypothetical protein [Corticibacter populi]RMX08503.1 hypothetical protein D8I35_05345 [Corticibacter populi]RZS35815.1 hypothetical protein EV687_0894 [Corticibacter populi]
MTLSELIRRFRTLANDKVEPYFWSDAELTDWFNDAQDQASVRGRLLRDTTTPAVCRIDLLAGQQAYPLHPALYEIISLQIQPAPDHPRRDVRRVAIKAPEWLDQHARDWRAMDCPAIWALQDETTLTLVGKLVDGEVLEIEAYRLPLRRLDQPSDEPEIHQASHVHLIQWVLHQAFSIPDTEVFDPQRSINAEAAFTRYFGPLPDSDMRRITREDVVHQNVSILA